MWEERQQPDPRTRPVRTAAPFVGRRAEIEWLERWLAEALHGQTRVVLLSGDAGIGKTRLLRELRSIAQERGARVCYGRCHEDLAPPYLPFIESVLPDLEANLGGDAPAPGSDAAVVCRMLRREVSQPPDAGAAGSGQTDQERLRLFQAVSRSVLALAQRQPTVLILDDAHWADGASLDLLAHLVFAVSDAAVREAAPLLVICSYRPGDPPGHLAHVVARLQREETCRTLELAGLADAEVREFLTAMEVTRPAQQLVATIAQATQGNPLFIQEVLHHLLKKGALEERGGHFVATVPAADLHLPAQVTSAITARAEGLSQTCRTVLTLAAVLGDSFSVPVLSAVSGLPEEPLLDLLEDGVRQRLLVSDGQGFQFAHPLVRHVFYTTQSGARRQRLHHQVATTLAVVYADRRDEHVMEIAHHVIIAAPLLPAGQVVDYARRAGERACTVFAWGDAARYYSAAAAAAASAELPVRARAELHYWAGFAYARDRDIGPATDQFDRAIAAYRQCGDVRGWARALADKTHAQSAVASVSYGTLHDVQPLEEALQLLGDDPPLCGRIWAIMSNLYWVARQPDKAEDTARRALHVGRQLDDHALCAHALVQLALAQAQALHPQEAVASYEGARECARRAADPWLEAWPVVRLALALTWLGRLDEAEAVANEGIALTRRTCDWQTHSLALAALAVVAVSRGDFEAAEQYAHGTMQMLRRAQYPWGGALALSALAGARCARGAWKEAEDAIDALVEPGRVFDEPGPALHLIAWLYRQHVRLCAGDVDAVRAQFATMRLPPAGRDRTDLNALAGFCTLVEISTGIAAPHLTGEAYAILSDAAARGLLFSSGWVYLLPRILGVAAAANARWEEAEAHLRTAIDAATRVGARPELARTQLDYARMLVARGAGDDRERAAELVVLAGATCADLDMAPSTRQVAEVAAALGLSLAPAPAARPVLPHGLSPHEAAVLRRMAAGRTTEEIADDLTLSRATVTAHERRLLRKLGVRSRAAAAAYAVAQALVTLPPPSRPAASPAAGPLPLVIVFTDMEGSTALIQRVGDVRARDVLRVHNAILRRCLATHGGTELNSTGDGVLAAFRSASAAIEAASAIQRALGAHNRAHPDAPIRVRIGINAGEPLSDGTQIFGAAVNAAARICARARAGQILVADVIRQLTAGKPVHYVSRGRHRLKGFAERFALYEVQWGDDAGTSCDPTTVRDT
jgi:class 3 adenylate cyclase/tetratricopeptide (TPR) repeat protein